MWNSQDKEGGGVSARAEAKRRESTEKCHCRCFASLLQLRPSERANYRDYTTKQQVRPAKNEVVKGLRRTHLTLLLRKARRKEKLDGKRAGKRILVDGGA